MKHKIKSEGLIWFIVEEKGNRSIVKKRTKLIEITKLFRELLDKACVIL